ncbi:TRAP transporter small permease [Lutimaribacter marinistellae]|uniref:TRAP transporter small permease protein n=1 Tax=Lutimaribacter marinistellae TaxID=1820329 RepID=A0ABV7TCW8_9RHOB
MPRHGWFGGAIRAVIRASFVLAQISLAALAAITFIEVVSRYFFSSPTIWASDAVRYLMACVIIFGLPDVTLNQQHVAIDLFTRKFSAEGLYNRGLSVLCAIVSAIASLIFLDVFIGHLNSGALTQGLWKIHRYWLSGALVFGFAMSTLTFVMVALSPARKG